MDNIVYYHLTRQLTSLLRLFKPKKNEKFIVLLSIELRRKSRIMFFELIYSNIKGNNDRLGHLAYTSVDLSIFTHEKKKNCICCHNSMKEKKKKCIDVLMYLHEKCVCLSNNTTIANDDLYSTDN